MTSKVYTRKRKPRAGIVAASVLAAGLAFGTAGVAHELAAPTPAAAVHTAAPVHAETPAVAVPAAGGTSAKAPAVHIGQHHILRDVFMIHRVLRPHRLHLLPWWLRRH